MAIVVEEGNSGAEVAAPIFKEIADANVIGNPTEGALLIRLREEGFDLSLIHI